MKPENTTNKQVNWRSENPEVAVEFQDVFVIARNEGSDLYVTVARFYGDESYAKLQ